MARDGTATERGADPGAAAPRIEQLPSAGADPQGTRRERVASWALEWAFELPYAALVAEARRTGACEELDLQQLGRRLFLAAARLYRGEISSIENPARLPRRGEHAPSEQKRQ